MVECPKWSNGVLKIGQMAEKVNQMAILPNSQPRQMAKRQKLSVFWVDH